jgi:superoxide dismutase, Cu-Zn family
MRYQQRTLLLTGALVAVLAPLALTALAQRSKEAVDQESDAQAAAKEESHGTKQPLTATQGTPVLGVVIGKRIDVEAAEVVRIWPGSPAEQAGLQKGDQIIQVDDKEIKSPEALRVAVLNREPGERVRLTIFRDGQRQTLKVRLSGADGLSGWTRRGQLPEVSEAPAWLGVRVDPDASATDAGVIVSRVLPGSPADAAGLQQGDAIVQIEQTRVEAAADLKMAVFGREPGETVKLVIRRDDQRETVAVELGTFAKWHADVSQLTDGEVRELLHELLTAPLSLAEELLPEESSAKKMKEDKVQLPSIGVAGLIPTRGNKASGVIVLRETNDGLHITGRVTGLTPGLHGFHIHEYGDVRAPDASAAGDHYNPDEVAHGGPRDEEHHAGDLGNIKANKNGVATVDIKAPWLKLHFIIGRSIIVHAGEDDLTSQPSGDAGGRVAMGVIGIAEAPQPGKS